MFFQKTVEAIREIRTRITTVGDTAYDILNQAKIQNSKMSKALGVLEDQKESLEYVRAMLDKAMFTADKDLGRDQETPYQDLSLEVMALLNGYIVVTLGDREYILMGGPYRNKGEVVGVPGVKLAMEIKQDYDVRLDIPDFGTPTVQAAELALHQAFLFLKGHRAIYAGCMGGIGRTGLFLALMMRVIWYLEDFEESECDKFSEDALAPHPDPVDYIRNTYLAGAIETQGQEDFIREFPAERVAWALYESGLFR